jgi:hypothetical protein
MEHIEAAPSETPGQKLLKFFKVWSYLIKGHFSLLTNYSQAKRFFTNQYILALLDPKTSLGEKLAQEEKERRVRLMQEEKERAERFKNEEQERLERIQNFMHKEAQLKNQAPEHKEAEVVLPEKIQHFPFKARQTQMSWSYEKLWLFRLIKDCAPQKILLLGDWSATLVEELKCELPLVKFLSGVDEVETPDLALVMAGQSFEKVSIYLSLVDEILGPKGELILWDDCEYFPKDVTYHPDVLKALNAQANKFEHFQETKISKRIG